MHASTDTLDRDSGGRRRAIATAVSIVLHAGLVVLVCGLSGGGAVLEPPQQPRASLVDIVVPPRTERPLLASVSKSGAPGTAVRAPTPVAAGARGRRGHAVRALAPAVADTVDPFAELDVSYERGDPDLPRPGTGVADDGVGLGGAALGRGAGYGIGGPLGSGEGGSLRVPPAPPDLPSLARPPRPKRAYRRWSFRAPRAYAGTEIMLELAISPGGKVSQVRLLKGVNGWLDDRAMWVARDFEFYPALDDYGHPIASVHRWIFMLEDEYVDFYPGQKVIGPAGP